MQTTGYKQMVSDIIGIREDGIPKYRDLVRHLIFDMGTDSPNVGIPISSVREIVAQRMNVTLPHAAKVTAKFTGCGILAKCRRDKITPNRNDHLTDDADGRTTVLWVTPLGEVLFALDPREITHADIERIGFDELNDYITWCNDHPTDAENETWFWRRQYAPLLGWDVGEPNPAGFLVWSEYVALCRTEGVEPGEKPDWWGDDDEIGI